jgi:peptide methionine sulfoxide reductase MsrB
MSGLGRRVHDVDGTSLPYWNPANFQPERDESCRVVFKPKDGSEFFQKNLRKEDYVVMQREAMEQPFFSKYNRFYPRKGHFCCKACGNPLYDHTAKLKIENGWPAFGACIDGAVGIRTAEKRKEKEEKERNAATRLQSFVRGCLTRAKVAMQVGMLIVHVKELEKELENEEFEDEPEEYDDLEPSDIKLSKKSNRSGGMRQSLSSLSLHSLDLSLSDGESLSSSFASFGDDSFSEIPAESKSTSKHQSQGSEIAASAASAAINRTQDRASKSAVLSALGELFLEIHCHRCKSYLGKVFEEGTRGQNGETYQERHQVNGRSLKYVEDDLPRRTMSKTKTSILFANQSQMRLMGLKIVASAHKEPEFASFAKTRKPFVSPRSKRRTVGESYKSPKPKAKPGIGVSFQSPDKSPGALGGRRRLSSKQKKLENFFLSKSVH